jgi:hypothetical protein
VCGSHHHPRVSLHISSLQTQKCYKNLKKVYDGELGHLPENSRPFLAKFQKTCSSGAKFADFAAGGCVYILILVAGLRERTKVASLPGQTSTDIARFLHVPPEGMGTMPN